MPPRHAQLQTLEVVQRVDRQLGVDQVHVVVDMADEIHAELLVELPRQLATAIGVEHHVPVVRVVQSQRIGAEEHTRRHATRPVDGEDVHPLEHAVAHRIHQLEIAGDGTRRKRLERQFAVGQVDHAAAPVLEDAIPGRARLPGTLDPVGLLRLGVGDVRRGDRGDAAGRDRAAGERHGLHEIAAGLGDALDGLAERPFVGVVGHRLSSSHERSPPAIPSRIGRRCGQSRP